MGRKKSKLKKLKNKKKTPMAVRSSSAPPWIELPRDLTANILHRLGAIDILENAQKVCTTWRAVCQDPAMWRVIDIRNLDCVHGSLYDLNIMCRHAVDRSQGQLIEIHIEYFGDDEMLHYICERSSHLRHLTLASCYDISGKALSEAVKKLSELEELHLIIMPSILAGDIENIGISCPTLKSFTYNERGCRHPRTEGSEDDDLMDGTNLNEYALAIAKNMPNLCHLRLFANEIKNAGLEAVLDGCPHLESLDLRQCFGVDLGGDLGKRCQQIKELRRPFDSIADYEWYAGESCDEPYYSSGYSDDYSFGDYDDYTNPFSSEYFPDNEAWFFDHDYI
ncbi:hypothetical protein Pfo_012619 [Paulownia fortunei]|nr:hypothetical protein Pfo_012619 [Paulownia fortunei]